MSTNAIPAYGTLLKMGDGAVSETFTTVMEVTKIGAPNISLKKEDATHHGSNGWEEVIGTLLKGDDIPVDVNWIPGDPTHDSTTGVLAAILGRSKKNWKLVLPDAALTTFNFKAIVSDFKGDEPVEGKLKASFSLTPSGPVTVTLGG